MYLCHRSERGLVESSPYRDIIVYLRTIRTSENGCDKAERMALQMTCVGCEYQWNGWEDVGLELTME